MYQLPVDFEQGVFRTYDIRGTVAEDSITPDLAYGIGRAIGAEAAAHNEHTVIVGRDGRLSAPQLMPALQAGLMESGCDIVDVGLVTSPALYFATHYLPYATGVMLTASHNPKDHNGFKTVLKGVTLSTAGVQKLKKRLLDRDLPTLSHPGVRREACVKVAYQEAIVSSVTLSRPLKVVVDSGNGTAGDFAPDIYHALGCEVISIFEEVDGNFPNHHPDPTVPANLEDLRERVLAEGADLGLAFDGDSDRLGMVTNSGEIIWPDRQMMLFSQSVLADYPGASIIFDVKCSNQLATVIESAGGKPVMSQTGHSLVKENILSHGAPLGGEMSGHIFFNDRWYGFDDGIYVGARLLEILSHTDKSVDEVFAALPSAVSTPELKVPIDESKKAAVMDGLLRSPLLMDADRNTLDGLRVVWSDGWGLVRRSNTSAYLTARFEGDTQEALARIKRTFREALDSIAPELDVPW